MQGWQHCSSHDLYPGHWFEACVIEISSCYHSGWHFALLCDVSDVTINETFLLELLLCCVTYVTDQYSPVSYLRSGPIHISQNNWTIYRSFEIVLKWGLSVGLELKSNVLCKPLL